MPDSFKFQEVSEEFVVKEFKSLNISKSTGLDGIPARFIKDAAEVIKGPITYIVNLSLRSGIFPNEMKLAKVIPLHNKIPLKRDASGPEGYSDTSGLY